MTKITAINFWGGNDKIFVDCWIRIALLAIWKRGEPAEHLYNEDIGKCYLDVNDTILQLDIELKRLATFKKREQHFNTFSLRNMLF
jgi:hypothetical protein